MIIGICGLKQSGKDTVSNMLSKLSGFEVTRFALKLKEVTCVLSGCTMEQLEDNNFKETELVPGYLRGFIPEHERHNPTYRKFLQYFGTNVCRKYSSSIWVDSLFETKKDKNLIIADCRFLDEALAIKNRGGIIIRIEREGLTADNHPSEEFVNKIDADFTIKNNGTLEDLEYKVEYIWKAIS